MLVGTLGGDLLKINMDFKEKYFTSHVMFPRRFTNTEYMHSASVTLVRVYYFYMYHVTGLFRIILEIHWL